MGLPQSLYRSDLYPLSAWRQTMQYRWLPDQIGRTGPIRAAATVPQDRAWLRCPNAARTGELSSFVVPQRSRCLVTRVSSASCDTQVVLRHLHSLQQRVVESLCSHNDPLVVAEGEKKTGSRLATATPFHASEQFIAHGRLPFSSLQREFPRAPYETVDCPKTRNRAVGSARP
jgi:hypothetical protein